LKRNEDPQIQSPDAFNYLLNVLDKNLISRKQIALVFFFSDNGKIQEEFTAKFMEALSNYEVCID
jgi:hypothetical protein